MRHYTDPPPPPKKKKKKKNGEKMEKNKLKKINIMKGEKKNPLPYRNLWKGWRRGGSKSVVMHV